MALYRHALPQLGGEIFLTDGGLETTLVFLEGVNLPCFVAFPLVNDPAGRERLKRYFLPYITTARERGVGFILDTPTWRANTDWGEQLGYSPNALAEINRQAVAMLAELRNTYATERTRIVINGVIGPRGDGYKADTHMSADEAQRYHDLQVTAFRDSEADMVSAITMTYPAEAIGIARAAQASDMPVVISFTVETDGKLPSGDTLQSAIDQVDEATGGAPAYYMINCAHPLHFEEAVSSGGRWLDRIRGIRANASTMSHAELDQATELDIGDPVDLGQRYRKLRGRLSRFSVMGGCCGTDHRHITAMCEACLPSEAEVHGSWANRRVRDMTGPRRGRLKWRNRADLALQALPRAEEVMG
jgi:homocysteine S-methyltransferase